MHRVYHSFLVVLALPCPKMSCETAKNSRGFIKNWAAGKSTGCACEQSFAKLLHQYST